VGADVLTRFLCRLEDFLTVLVGARVKENLPAHQALISRERIGLDEFKCMADVRLGVYVRQRRRYIERLWHCVSLPYPVGPIQCRAQAPGSSRQSAPKVLRPRTLRALPHR